LGFSTEELPLSNEKAECCGFGVLMFNADPAMAGDVIKHRTTTIDPSGTSLYRTKVNDNDYLAYCAMCRDNLAAGGKRTSHLIEHLFPTVPGNDPAARAGYPGPSDGPTGPGLRRTSCGNMEKVEEQLWKNSRR